MVGTNATNYVVDGLDGLLPSIINPIYLGSYTTLYISHCCFRTQPVFD